MTDMGEAGGSNNVLNSPSSSYTTATAQGRGAALLLSPGQESSTGSPLAGDRHVNAATANGGAFPPSPLWAVRRRRRR